MDRSHMHDFLSKVSVLEYKYRIKSEDEEIFNVFTVLHKSHNEVQLHSRFISHLLSPSGTHQKQALFLKIFLEEVLEIMDFELDGVEVIPNELTWTEYKEIDILIVNRKTQQAVFIENKIYAKDSNHENRGQLEGYYNQLLREGIPAENLRVYYLTLDRHEPSPESLGGYELLENMNGCCIEYGREITIWLEKCLKEIYDKPALREVIIQYQKLIQKMTHDIPKEEQLELKELVAANIESSKLLFDNFNHIKYHAIVDFWKNIVCELTDRGYSVTEEPSDQVMWDMAVLSPSTRNYSKKVDAGVRFNLRADLSVYIWNGTGDDWLYWGVDQKGFDEKYREAIDALLVAEAKSSQYSVMWKYFSLSDEENIYLQDFSYKGTFQLINPDYCREIAKRLIDEVEGVMCKVLEK